MGPNWPHGGEIDILEGVNDYTNNGMTLHTGPGCLVGSDLTQFSGEVTTPNCDVKADGQKNNAGCSIAHPSEKSYGQGLNENGGGVYAMEWNTEAISVYFFPREAIPADVLGDNPQPNGWGKPAAKFAGACDIDKMFAEQKIIIDTTFCGQWAGAEWEESSCGAKAATCNEYVRDNPEAFVEAYWEINALKVYKDDGNDAPVPSIPAMPSKSTVASITAPVSTVKSSYPTVAPPASSQPVVPPPSSKSAPAASSKASSAPVIPPVSSQTLVPKPSSKLAPGASSKAPSVPAAPRPTSAASAPSQPSSGPQSSQASVRPSRTLDDNVNMPTGVGGMPGWQWPIAIDDGSQDSPDTTTPATSAASSGKSSGTPAQKTSDVLAVPTNVQNIVQQPSAPAAPVAPVAPAQSSAAAPSITNIAAAPAQPSNVPPSVSDILAPSEALPVRTICKTVYKTVTADPVSTPAPESKSARLARQLREHRMRWTRHNVRV